MKAVEKPKKRIEKYTFAMGTILIAALILMAGPIHAVSMLIDVVIQDINGDGVAGPGDNATVTANVTIENGELVPIINVTLNITNATATVFECPFPMANYTFSSYSLTCTDAYGNTINVDLTFTFPAGFGYGVGYGYADGFYWVNITELDAYGFNVSGFGWGYGNYGWNASLNDYQYGFGSSWFKYTAVFSIPANWETTSYTTDLVLTTPERFEHSEDKPAGKYDITATNPDTFDLNRAFSNAGGGGLQATTSIKPFLETAGTSAGQQDYTLIIVVMAVIILGAALLNSRR